jgi:hypothetical protein
LAAALAILVPATTNAHLSVIRQGPESRGAIEAGDRFGAALAAADFNNGDGFDGAVVRLLPAWPNPFQLRTRLAFDLGAMARAE